MHRFGFLILIVLVFVSMSSGQYPYSGYYEGTGEAEDLQEAKELALADLSRSIETYICSRFQSIQEGKNFEVTKDFVESQIESYSSICLRNVRFHKERRGKRWFVIARVPEVEVQKVFEERKLNIRTMLNTAIRAELSGDISTALKNYYWSYIMTYAYPDTILISLPPDYIRGNARTLLVDKINSVFKGISYEIRKSYIDGDDFVLVVEFSYEGKSVADMQFYYYNGSEQAWGEVINGKAYLILNGNFSGVSKRICLDVEYRFENEMPQNREVEFIYHRLDFPEFDNSIFVPVNLSGYVKVDFDVVFRGNVVTFLPVLKHVSVSSVRWDFGDGETSMVWSPIHAYPDSGTYLATLRVNGDPELTVIKRLSLRDGTAEDVEREKTALLEEKESVPTIGRGETAGFSTGVDYSCLKQLIGAKDVKQFVETARKLSWDGRIVFGSSKDFESREGLYCFVFDRDSGYLEAVYLYGDGGYTDLGSGKKIDSLRGKYKGRRMAAIWVEVIERSEGKRKL